MLSSAKGYKTKYYNLFIIEIPNGEELQQTAIIHSCDIDFKDFTKLYRQKHPPEVFYEKRCS